MITINNRQRKIKINLKKLSSDAHAALELLNYHDFDLGILITTNASIRKYNATFRHKDKPTDILSFPFYPDLRPGERIKASADDEKNLGDIIISAEYVAHQIKGTGATLDERMLVLLVHGIFHLLGYDHITDAQYAQMRRKELGLLKELGVTPNR